MKNKLNIIIIATSFFLILNPTWGFRQYFTDYAGVRLGVNQNHMDASGETNDNQENEIYGDGYGVTFLFSYDFKMGQLFFSLNSGIMNIRPKITQRINQVVISEETSFVSNFFITSFLFKLPLARGLYLGIGASGNIPMRSPDEITKPKPDVYLVGELGYVYILTEKLILSFGTKVSFNVSNQYYKGVDYIDQSLDYNTQFLLGIGYRLEQ